MKKTTILAVALLFSVCFLCGCNEQGKVDIIEDEERFFGSWNLWTPSGNFDTTLTFNTNGSIKEEVYDAEKDNTSIEWSFYEIDKNNVEICCRFNFLLQIPPTDETECYKYQFSNNYQDLKISDNQDNEIFSLIKT